MVQLRDVTLRDGLQDERVLSTEAKVAIFDSLVAAGVRDLELTAFVRPDRVPAMSDADALSRATSHATEVRRWGLVLNERGAARALAAGLRDLQFVLSVSEAHNRNNAGRSVAESLDELRAVIRLAGADDAAVELTIATAFGCPFVGPIPPDEVLAVVKAAVESGVDGVSLADTIGSAVPTEVRELVKNVRRRHASVEVGVHLHDTRGLGVANALAALEAGAVRIDASVGGLGGCPFAPGASGNVALEDVAHALQEMGIDVGLDIAALVETSRLACSLVDRPVGSHVGVAGPRFASLAPAQLGPGRRG